MKLRVLCGRHRGAEVSLDANAALVIGSDPEADIVLSDTSVLPRHARLVTEGRRHFVSPLADAPVWHGQRRVDEPLGWRAGDVLRVGDVELVLLHDALAAEAEADDPASDPAEAAALPALVTAATADAATNARSGRGASAVGVLAMGCLVLAAVCAGWLVMAPPATARAAVSVRAPLGIAEAQAALQAQGHLFVKPTRDYRGETVLSGVVDDSPQAARVKQWAGVHLPGARLALITGPELAAKLRAEADDPGVMIDFAGGNRVSVSGTPQRAGTRSKIVRVIGEWPGLVEIAPDPSYLKDAEASSAPQVQRKPLPLKFAMLNVGPAAYIESTDGARYFVGSALPDGSVVRSIDSERVMVEAAGKLIEYRFVN